MAQSSMKSIFKRINDVFDPVSGYSARECADLRAHGDAWLGKRNPKLEKRVRLYSY